LGEANVPLFLFFCNRLMGRHETRFKQKPNSAQCLNPKIKPKGLAGGSDAKRSDAKRSDAKRSAGVVRCDILRRREHVEK